MTIKSNKIGKSLFIKNVLDQTSKVSLLTKPIKFGKSLDVISKLGYYPLIYLTLKDVKGANFEEMLVLFREQINKLYKKHMYLLKSNRILDIDKEMFRKILTSNARKVDIQFSINLLSRLLYKEYEKSVYLIIDEYDVPLLNAYIKDFYRETHFYHDVVEFFRLFYGISYKDSIYIEKVVITGVSKVDEDSIYRNDPYGILDISIHFPVKYYINGIRKTNYGKFQKAKLKKLPIEINNYEDLIQQNRIYVDKTMYIEKLENLSNPYLRFYRPKKFGKTLFVSTLENYYDKSKADKFGFLFGNTYIGKNPTPNKNRYCILKFDFSGLDTSNVENTIKDFKDKTIASVREFVYKYGLEFSIKEQDEAEYILHTLFTEFYIQKPEDKIYVIIDNYDCFSNDLLDFKTKEFNDAEFRNKKITTWYTILKEGTERVVSKIFITGTIPILFDELTSGFNIASDITMHKSFNGMLGFNENDIKYLINELKINKENQDNLLHLIKESYGGYIFSDELENYTLEKYKICNPNMSLYLLKKYAKFSKIQHGLIGTNIIDDYTKARAFVKLCQDTNETEILEKIIKKEYLETKLSKMFYPKMYFTQEKLISLLYYFGYLTIKDYKFSLVQLEIPNKMIKIIFLDIS